ncbi:MAG: hypothetical protein M1812_001627 [Candelaria pacifica]|nr:MAG: hypothetical protein M1812_001627 [Candelaria pacifica]
MDRLLHKEVEILIHVSAPSGAKDDNKYRKQAAAYFEFDCHNVFPAFQGQLQASTPFTRLTHTTDGGVSKVNEAPPCRRDPPYHSTWEERPSTSIRQDDPEATSASAYSASWHLATSSSEYEEHAPSLLTNARPAGHNIPPFSIQSTPHTDSSVRQRVPSSREPRRITTDTPERPLKIQEQTVRSEPSTQYGSWRTPSSVISNSQPSSRLLLHHGQSSPQQSPSNLRPSKRCRLQREVSKEPATVSKDSSNKRIDSGRKTPSSPLVLPSAVTDSSKTPPPHDQDPSVLSSPSLHTQKPSEIHPPPPPTSTLSPVKSEPSHITPTLSMLASRIDISKRYQPLHKTRALRPLERGYWCIDTSSWSPQLQDEFWAFLQDLIGDGRAGWGVWCHKSANVGEDKLSGVSDNRCSDGYAIDGDDVVRVYCWGEVVGHIYLVIFLASTRKIKGTGARWIDSGGEVVVQMA